MQISRYEIFNAHAQKLVPSFLATARKNDFSAAHVEKCNIALSKFKIFITCSMTFCVQDAVRYCSFSK